MAVVVYAPYIHTNFQTYAAENEQSKFMTLYFVVYGGTIAIFSSMGLYGAVKNKLPFIFIVLSFFVAAHIAQTLELMIFMDIIQSYSILNPIVLKINKPECFNATNDKLDVNNNNLHKRFIGQTDKQPRDKDNEINFYKTSVNMTNIHHGSLKIIWGPFLALKWLGILSVIVYTVQYLTFLWQNRRLNRRMRVFYCKNFMNVA